MWPGNLYFKQEPPVNLYKETSLGTSGLYIKNIQGVYKRHQYVRIIYSESPRAKFP